MSAQNLGPKFYKWDKVNATSTKQIGSSGEHVVLGGIIVNSHTNSTFRLADGTLTSFTPIAGSYTPATGSSSIVFEPIDFNSGCVIVIAGTADYTVLYNTLP